LDCLEFGGEGRHRLRDQVTYLTLGKSDGFRDLGEDRRRTPTEAESQLDYSLLGLR
jgi:hypothetical protein